MKRIILLSIGLLMMAGTASAQVESYIELLRTDIQAQRQAVVTEALPMEEDAAKAFWPVYREYQLEKSKLGDSKLTLIEDYANAYDSMTDEVAKGLMDRVFKGEEADLKLQKDWYKKFEKVLGSAMAARFMQIDRQIDMLIDVQIATNLPLLEVAPEAPAEDGDK